MVDDASGLRPYRGSFGFEMFDGRANPWFVVKLCASVDCQRTGGAELFSGVIRWEAGPGQTAKGRNQVERTVHLGPFARNQVELRPSSRYKSGVVASTRPTRNRLRLAMVVALLFSGLALAEFPELLQLKDDTSNDFTLVVARQEVTSPNYAAKSGPTPAAIFIKERSIQAPISPLALSFSDPVVQSSIDYLHLLCVHRT